MTRILVALALLTCLAGTASAQQWLTRGYAGFGTYRAWPGRGFSNWGPGLRYYAPGAYQPFSYWRRNPGYRY